MRTRDGRFQPIIIVAGPDGKPTRRRLRALPEGTTEARAREVAAHYQERADHEGWARPAPTRKPAAERQRQADEREAEAWWSAYFEARATKLRTKDKARDHYRAHVRHVLASHPRDWTPADLRRFVAYLDAKVTAGELAATTAAKVWSTVTGACKAASTGKVEALRVRADDPSRDVEGPDSGGQARRQFLYPSEVLRLASCEAIPLDFRRLAVLAAYLYARPGELAALRWRDVDLDLGVVHFHAATNERGERGANKTRSVRTVAVEPTLLPLLRAMRREAPEAETVVTMGTSRAAHQRLAEPLREALLAAGVDRPELHTREATSHPLVWYSLRHTGLTWRALRGDEPMRIMADAGHAQLATTQGYIRTASSYDAARLGETFPPLPPCLLGDHDDAPPSPGSDHTVDHEPHPGETKGPEGLRQTLGTCDNADMSTVPHGEQGQNVKASVRNVDADQPRDHLEAALHEASKAGRWDIVALLARELEARRLDGSNVVALAPEKRRR